jgi:hypothetical protein
MGRNADEHGWTLKKNFTAKAAKGAKEKRMGADRRE